jgi:phosphopantetheine adenylyltransferase
MGRTWGSDSTNNAENTMSSMNKQLVAEVMTVMVLASATFFSVSPDSAAIAPRHSGMITLAVQNAPELPQELVRDYSLGD